MIKTKLEHLEDILNAQEAKIVGCDIDITLYTRKNLIVKDAATGQAYTNKIEQLKAVKVRAEEIVEIIKGKIADLAEGKEKN